MQRKVFAREFMVVIAEICHAWQRYVDVDTGHKEILVEKFLFSKRVGIKQGQHGEYVYSTD